MSNKKRLGNSLFPYFLIGRKAAPIKDFRNFYRALLISSAVRKRTNPWGNNIALLIIKWRQKIAKNALNIAKMIL
jgi:hypothetical protein